MSWENYFRDDVLKWLLETENPSVRFWTLQHLQDKHARDKEVVQTQSQIMNSECVRTILDALNPEGYWLSSGNMYEPKYQATTHNLLLLAELGSSPVPEIKKAIEHLFKFQRNSGHFLMNMPKTEKGRDSIVKDGCCLDGNIMYYLVHFGYLEDSRFEKLLQFQIDYHSSDGGWNCRAFPINPDAVFPTNCFMGAVKALRGLAAIPEDKRTPDVQKIIDVEIENILQNGVFKYLRNPDGTRKVKAGWKKFGFPLFYQSDVLEVLDILTSLGVKDERMKESIELVVKSQDTSGRWLLKNTYNGKMYCNFDEKNKPSKWITLRALRVLKKCDGV